MLLNRHPALLTDYRDAYNAQVRKERQDRTSGDDAPDTRSTPQKMLDLANFERSGPKRVVEASLEGLAASRHRLAGSPVAYLEDGFRLRLAYKLRPKWRPVMTVEELEPLEGLSAAALKAMDPPRYRTGGMMR